MDNEIPNPFNINSTAQLIDLFYNELGFEVLEYTEKKAPSIGKRCLPHLGKLGNILINYRKLRDQRKFVTSLEKSQREGRLHPNMKIPGTITGRLAGGIEK